MQLIENILFDSRYRLKSLLRKGGFYESWLVEDTRVGNKQLELKVFAPDTGLDEDGIQMFSSELEAIVFDHHQTNLMHLVHFNIFERSPYLLIPYSGQSAAGRSAGKITDDDIRNFLHDVAAELANLHSQQPPAVHQDFISGNRLKEERNSINFPKPDENRSKQPQQMPKPVDNAPKQPQQTSKPTSVNRKTLLAVAAGILALLVAIAVYYVTGDKNRSLSADNADSTQIAGRSAELQPPAWLAEYDQIMQRAQSAFDSGDYQNARTEYAAALALLAANQDNSGKEADVKNRMAATDKAIEDKAKAPATPATSSTAWIAEYERYTDVAKAAFDRRDYTKAKTEYSKALTLVNRIGDRQKITYVTGQIAACDKALEAAKSAAPTPATTPSTPAASAPGDAGKRLEAYNFVGSFMLGTNYMVVQNKENNLWGIIDRAGNEVEAAVYIQVSERLKDGNYALRNSQGWIVFDKSLKKIATGLQALTDYQ